MAQSVAARTTPHETLGDVSLLISGSGKEKNIEVLRGLDYRNWRHRTWIPATRQAGFSGLQFHDLRRTATTALVQERIDMKTAQTRLGHADPRTTLAIYAQATKEPDRQATERRGVRFRPPEATPSAPLAG
jgi:integrase